MSPAVKYLLSAKAIRERCSKVFEYVEKGHSSHFQLQLENLEPTAEFVRDITLVNYPDLVIPFHGRKEHIICGDVDRFGHLRELCLRAGFGDEDYRRSALDLTVISVLLDAGAGRTWGYKEPGTNRLFQRSEGLAVASYHAFIQGAFSSNKKNPYQVDAAGLMHISSQTLGKHFQVSIENPLEGLEGRTQLLKNLGGLLEHSPFFPGKRLAGIFNSLQKHSAKNQLEAEILLQEILTGFGAMWPGRLELDGYNLGDTWKHAACKKSGDPTSELVPFHKLSQWLCYSLLEPLQDMGLTTVNVDKLTGLAEYRNGGLFTDNDVIVPKFDAAATVLDVGSEAIVEWRALTVVLLDRLGDEVQKLLNKSSQELPLAKILQGGTWQAGRMLAQKARPDGSPPLRIKSDGTVF
ncbi:MAG: DUF1688 family protein [Oligoflexales bacterium]